LDKNIALSFGDECWNAEATHAAPAPLIGLKVQDTYSADNSLDHLEISSTALLGFDYSVTRGSGCR